MTNIANWIDWIFGVWKFHDDHNGAVTAVATIAIALFTIVLARVTGQQARLTRQSIDLARAEFVSTHRPRIIVRNLSTLGLLSGISSQSTLW